MKDRDNGKGKVWEKNRRDRLKDSFHKLGQLLPHYDPAKIIPQQEILDKATQFVKELRLSNSRLLTQQTQADEKSKLIQELQDEVNKLILRVKQLTMLLNEANITIPAGPSLKLLGKRKLKFTDKLVAADDVESPAKRKATNEDIETTKENEKESTSQSDVGNTVNGTASTPLRETNGCAVTSISTVAAAATTTTTTTNANGDKERSGETIVSNEVNSSTSTTISIPVSVPPTLQISPNASPTQSSIASIQATLKPLTFTLQNTPTTTIFLAPHSLTPITTRFTIPPHRILPKPNDPNNLTSLAKLPIVRVRQPIPVVKKKRRRRGKNSANDDNKTTPKPPTDSEPPPPAQNEDSVLTISTELSQACSQTQSASNESETITLISETLTVENVEMMNQPTPPPVSPNIASSSSKATIVTESLPEATESTSQNVNVESSETNLNLDDHHQINKNNSKVEVVTASTDSVINEQEIPSLPDATELETVSNANDIITSNGTEAEEKDETISVIHENGGDEMLPVIEPAATEDPVPPSDNANNNMNERTLVEGNEIIPPTTSSEIIQTSSASSIATTSVDSSNEVKSNGVENSQSSTGKDYVMESSKPVPDLPPPQVSDKYLEMEKSSEISINSSSMTTENNATAAVDDEDDDESPLVGPQPPPATHPVAVTNEIEMTNSHSLQEIVDNLMEAPAQVAPNQRLQLEDRNNEDMILSNSSSVEISPPIEQQPEEGGSVSNEKISECIARSIDLELSGDWGETGSDVNSPNPPISPTQMFLSMFPLLPRDSIIIPNETSQSTQQQPQQQGHKQQQQHAANFTSAVKSSSSSFYIDSMLPDTDVHFHRNSSIPVSVPNSNSAALISSNNSNCQDANNYHNILGTSNLLSLANTPTETDTLKSTGTTCLAMIPPVTTKRRVIDNTENAENHLHPFSFHFPPTTNITTSSSSSASGNKNTDNCSNSALKNHNVQQQQPHGLTDSDARNLHLTFNLHPDSSSRERITDLDSSFPIFSSSFMNNLTHHNSSLSCSKTTNNICSVNSNNNNNPTDSSNNNQRHRKEPEIGHWTPYEYPSYSMASITNKNTTDSNSVNNFIPSSSSSLTTGRHSLNSLNSTSNNMHNEQSKQQNHQQQQQQQLFLFDIPSSTSTSSSIKPASSNNSNKAYSSSEYVNNNVPQKNSQHASSTSVVSSLNTEQTVQNTNTHGYKPYMQNFHSQTQSHRHNSFNGSSSNGQQQHSQIGQHSESSSLIPNLPNMYGESSVTTYHNNNNNNKNQEQQQHQQQPDLFRPLSVPTSSDFLHHHHSQPNLQQKQQSANSNNNQTYSQQHNVLRSTNLNINLSSNNSSTAASNVSSSHQPKPQHNSKSRSSSNSRTQGERNNNTNSSSKTVPSFSSQSNSTSSSSRSNKSTSSLPLHSPYSSQFPIITNTSTNIIHEQRELQYRQLPQPQPVPEKSSSSNGSSGRSGATKTSSSNVQNCSRSASSSSSSSNSKRNYHRVQQSQSQPQNSSLAVSNQNPISSSLDFPPPPPPSHSVPSSTNFVMGNNFYENILPSGGHAQFSIGHHHHSKTQASSSSRHQPFYLPEVPVQNFDFMHHHHQPHTIGGPVNSSVPVPIAVPPLPLPPPSSSIAAVVPTISSQQPQKTSLSSTQRSSTIQNNNTHNNKGTTPYTYFNAPCHPVRGYSSAAVSSSSSGLLSNNKSDNNVMVSLTDTHNNNSIYGSSSNSSQSQQQHLPAGQNQLALGTTTAPAAKTKSTTQNNQSQQVYQANSHNNNSQHSHSSHHQSQQQPQRQQHPHAANNLSQSVPSNRPVNWMTDPLPLPQVPPSSSCNRKTVGDNSSSSSSIPNPFSVSKLVGNTNSSSNNNTSSSGNNNNNNNNYCVEGLIRKPTSSSSLSSDWNDFHLTSASSGHSMTSHAQPPPFVPYQAQPDYGNYANFPHHSHSHHHYTNTVAATNPRGHFVHHFDHSAVHTNPSSTGGGNGHNLHVQQQQLQHHSHHPSNSNNSHHQGIQILGSDSNTTNATISSHSHHPQGHHHHQQQQQQQQHGTSSVLNFNLSSIFPEMNDKRNSSNNSNNNNNNVCNYYPTNSTGGNVSNK